MRGAVYVNGKIAPADQAVVPVYDHGFVYGEGVYETLRSYNLVPFLYDRHMRRLRRGHDPDDSSGGSAHSAGQKTILVQVTPIDPFDLPLAVAIISEPCPSDRRPHSAGVCRELDLS